MSNLELKVIGNVLQMVKNTSLHNIQSRTIRVNQVKVQLGNVVQSSRTQQIVQISSVGKLTMYRKKMFILIKVYCVSKHKRLL